MFELPYAVKAVVLLLLFLAGVISGLRLMWIGAVLGMIRKKLPFHAGGYNEGIGAQIDGFMLAIFGLGLFAGSLFCLWYIIRDLLHG